ncbi:MAG: DUF2490 domain-containing protein [Acidobacteriota bacterium]
MCKKLWCPQYRRKGLLLALLFFCVLAVSARAQQRQLPEDPEDDKQLGLWLDQGLSAGLSATKSLEVEAHERFDDGASNLYEYFLQGGVAFRLRPWLSVAPIYRYQRFPGNPNIEFENRLLLTSVLNKPRGLLRPNFRLFLEGRFPDGLSGSARFRLRPGIDYTLPIHVTRPPVLVVNNEFFLVPGDNPFANGDSAYTQNRFQVGVRQGITDSVSVRVYYLLQSVSLPPGWDTNPIVGISLSFRARNKNSGSGSR